jgi:hypothetical protein
MGLLKSGQITAGDGASTMVSIALLIAKIGFHGRQKADPQSDSFASPSP